MKEQTKSDQKEQKGSTGTMADILTETELLALLGIKKSTLYYLRAHKRMPFCALSKTVRVYLVEDILEFMRNSRTVMNQADDPE